MFPRPARFINLRWRNIRTIRIRDLYRVLMEKIQLSEMTEGETYLGNIQLHIVHHTYIPELYRTRAQRVYLPE